MRSRSAHAVFRGRRTNSPLQFGHVFFIAAVQPAQNVHSNVQMYASPVGDSAALHFSHAARISNAMQVHLAQIVHHHIGPHQHVLGVRRP